MRGQQGFWLNNEECLPPGPHCSCQKHQDKPIRCGTCRAFDLSAQDNELLAQESVLGKQFGYSPGKIPNRPKQE
jgi:hypothetical protein